MLMIYKLDATKFFVIFIVQTDFALLNESNNHKRNIRVLIGETIRS